MRGTIYPDPVQAVKIVECAGADGITIHLREDRRHIKDRDVYVLKDILQTRMNLEIAATDEMINIALDVRPDYVCFVPEKREELTTEGGLDVVSQLDKIKMATKTLMDAGIKVSLFIDAGCVQINAAKACGAPYIELHTGQYADAKTDVERKEELKKIMEAASYANGLDIKVNAGHGLSYHNVTSIAAIPEIYELNIGHAIVCRALFDGLSKAVLDMKAIMQEARNQ
ncbi:Pyridoxine 5'-phosphate synthase [Candidatus Enterovibrio escicola]|uniref:Pyridoxine 5'-phosphate synthase n=1 Tax=Candidatus Enterovibrio escicola TaxID=1927127 RepID=A0A2A5T6N3_9GAMM|nr:Pyridoxine 5'-phosphate synthase [Candidatus Enterovibrio escacola]